MSTTSAKTVVLGVTGSIAAYKACDIASQLTKLGVQVIPVLTDSAQRFVGAASLEGITHHRAIVSLFEPDQNASIDHIELAQSADLFLIAPATANTLAKVAHGLADDWLSSALLATEAPLLFAPAMNVNMFAHPATQQNLDTLHTRGAHFVGPDSGVLACKTIGKGRMMEPDVVVEAAMSLLNVRSDFAGKRVLITSGANHEPIDPVRFIGNRSSGKMGHALAREALQRGADVTVISGPSEVPLPPGANVIHVQTALEMCDAVLENLDGIDVIIGAAAVADYRVETPLDQKHKRSGDGLNLALVENPDIIAKAGEAKTNGTIMVGFAAETNDLLDNARAKLERKKLDLIVANEVGTKDSGFGTDTVQAAIVDRAGHIDEFPVVSKHELARRLFDRIAPMLG